MKKFIILMGNYGSGKTELAMNFALSAAETGKTLLIDLDMINTYFRLNDRREMFAEKGIRLIAPNFANSGVEMLTVPAEIATAFAMDWDTVVIDLGGDAGAAALGQYHTKLAQAEKEGAEICVLDVVNTNRPMAGTPAKLIRLMEEMQFVEDLASGYEIVKQASEQTGIPVVYTTGKPEILEAFLQTEPDMKYVGEPVHLSTYMHRDWDTLTKQGV